MFFRDDSAPIVEDERPNESLKLLCRGSQALSGSGDGFRGAGRLMGRGLDRMGGLDNIVVGVCLLYTSDAADD